MGREISFKVVSKDYKIPREEDFENNEDYDKAYYKHLDKFKDLGCRNSWDGPYNEDFMFSKQEIINFLKNYLSSLESKNFEYTLKACVEIILSMENDNFVIIRYG